MPPRRLSIDLAVLAAFCAFLFYFGLGAFGLTGADEPRYAQIAREMLARHDWVTPILNGQPWLEKPIFYYWQAMISYRLFGVHDWAARVPSAFDASVMVFAVFVILRRIRAAIALDAALLTAATAFIFGFARAASTDMPLSAPFSVAMLGWLAWFVTRQSRYLAVFYVFLGLATLAKGPVAVGLAGLVLLIFIAIRREGSLIWKSFWLPGMALWAAVTLPWYILVQSRTPQFFHVFFVEHNLDRYTTNMFHHRQPFWYFGVVLLAALLPWTVFGIAGFARACRQWREARGDDRMTAVPVYLAVWGAVPVLFFSTSESKLPGYILPAIAAWSILAADYLHARWVSGEKGKGSRRMAAVPHAIVAGIFLGAIALAPNLIVHPKAKPPGAALAMAALVAIVVAVSMLARGVGNFGRLRTVTLAVVIVGVGFLLKVAGPPMDAAHSARYTAQAIARWDESGLPLAVYRTRREIEYGLNFYQNRPPVDLVESVRPAGKFLLLVPDQYRAEAAARLLPACTVDAGHVDAQGLSLLLVGAPQSCAR